MSSNDSVSGGGSGVVAVQARGTVDEVFARLESRVLSRGLTVFARIDFSGDARSAGLDMPPTRMLLFGNPKAGTPVMLRSPGAAIDLPLKVLIARAADGTTWLSFNSPEYLQQRHAIPAELLKNISGVEAIVREAANP